jgi:hypothetical protein
MNNGSNGGSLKESLIKPEPTKGGIVVNTKKLKDLYDSNSSIVEYVARFLLFIVYAGTAVVLFGLSVKCVPLGQPYACRTCSCTHPEIIFFITLKNKVCHL